MRTNQLTFLTAAIIPLTYLSGNWSSPTLGDPMLIKSAAAEIYASSLLLLYLFSQKPGDKFQIYQNLTVFIAVIFFIYISLSIIWAHNIGFFIDTWLKWFAASVTFSFAILIARTPDSFTVVIRMMVFSAFLVASIGIAQQYLDWNYLPQAAAPGSTFSNRNLAGHVIVICLPLAFFGLLLHGSSLKDKALSAAAIIIIGVYAYHTSSAGVWVSITVEITLISCFLIWLYMQKYRTPCRDRILIASLLTFAGVAFFLLISKAETVAEFFQHKIQESLFSLVETQHGDGSRLDIWAPAWIIFKESPILGIGLGNFYEVWSNGYVNHSNLLGIQRVHNDPLEIATNLGLIGFTLFTFLFILIIRSGARLVSHSEHQIQLASVLILCGLAGFIVNSLVSFPMQLVAPLVSVAILAGLLVGGEIASLKKTASKKIKKIYLRFVGIPTSMAILILSTYLNFHWLKDVNNISTQYNYGSQLTTWEPSSYLVNPNTINLLRLAVTGSLKYNAHVQANGFVSSLINIWPDEPWNLVLATEVNLNLDRLTNAEKIAVRLKKLQPIYSLSAEHYLLTIYSKRNDFRKLREIYSQFLQLEKEQLKADPRNIVATHCLSILFGDKDTTKTMFQIYREYLPQNHIIEANMAIFYANLGKPQKAYQTAQTSLTISEQFGNTLAFRKILSKEPASKPIEPFRREALEQLESDPILDMF